MTRRSAGDRRQRRGPAVPAEIEQDRAKDGEGSQVMHYFAPEITLALPQAPDIELMFRFHHRSGVFGVVSDAFGGAQYGTVGLRVRF